MCMIGWLFPCDAKISHLCMYVDLIYMGATCPFDLQTYRRRYIRVMYECYLGWQQRKSSTQLHASMKVTCQVRDKSFWKGLGETHMCNIPHIHTHVFLTFMHQKEKLIQLVFVVKFVFLSGYQNKNNKDPFFWTILGPWIKFAFGRFMPYMWV